MSAFDPLRTLPIPLPTAAVLDYADSMSALLTNAVVALLVTGTAQPSAGEQAAIADQNARAERQAFDDQLSLAARCMRENDMSRTGAATVLAGMRAEQQEARQISQEMIEGMQAMSAAADAEPFDATTFEAALKRYRASQAAAFSNALDTELQIIRVLSPQDQRIFAKVMHSASLCRLGIPARPLKGAH
jgi:hypothetical protein